MVVEHNPQEHPTVYTATIDDKSITIVALDEPVFGFNYRTQEAWVHPLYAHMYPLFVSIADEEYHPFRHQVN